MIGIELIRESPEKIRLALAKRGQDVHIDNILELDARRRALIAESDNLRAHRNKVSRQLGSTPNRPPKLVEEMREVGARIKTLESESTSIGEQLNSLLLELPNIPDEDVPEGKDESGNVLVRSSEKPPQFSFTPLPHWKLGEKLDIIDFRRGVKISGSRFYILKGKGAKLQRALISWMLDIHTNQHGYEEMYLPELVNRKTATGSGQLPKFAETMYRDEEDDLWMVPTAEVPLTGLHANEILTHDRLPIKYVAHTPCFRREKAAAGKDTRGIKRVHQFEKVELYKLVPPSDSQESLKTLVREAEAICLKLGLPYRVLRLCTGELSTASVDTFDIEVWAPGSDEWLEVSSCSNCTDFQARRSNIKYRPDTGARPQFIHTLNGSGLALPRVIAAILENFQNPNGGISIPDVLLPYTGFDSID